MVRFSMEFKVGSCLFKLVQGDITDQETDAVVNAANPTLMGGGGVDGAIHRRGGPSILEECKRIRRTQWPAGLPTGQAVITTGGNLKARYVIHTVGPVWRGGGVGEAEKLSEAYRNSLKLAVEHGLRTISFPSISTGAYRYPLREACRIALRTVREFVQSHDKIDEVRFVLFRLEDLKVYEEEAAKILGA